MESLEGVRQLVADNIGSISLLEERPGKRMAKHKSRALSPSLSRRYPYAPTASHTYALMQEQSIGSASRLCQCAKRRPADVKHKPVNSLQNKAHCAVSRQIYTDELRHCLLAVTKYMCLGL